MFGSGMTRGHIGTLRRIGTARSAFVLAAALGAVMLGTLPGEANDTTAALAAGGLVFVPTDDIAMQSEDLFISEQEVRVRYVFKSTAAKDVHTLVAFPMPDLTVSMESNPSIPVEDSENFLDFKTQVEGKPVVTKVELKAFALGIDRTQMLIDLKVPLAPQMAATGKALDALPQDKWQELLDIGLVQVDEFDAGKGTERHLAPRWSLKTTYYWMQTFPAGKELVVEHQYKPSVGMSVGTLVGMKVGKDNEWIAAEQRSMADTFCIDSTLLAAVDRASKGSKPEMQPIFSDARIHYILKTAGNWAGSVGDFTLTVDKGAPENLVSFCGTGVKKISPTRFQMKAKDFFPLKDLGILILKPYPKK